MRSRLIQFARGLTLAGVLVAAPVAALLGIPPRWPSELAASWDDISARCQPSRVQAAVARWLPRTLKPQPAGTAPAAEPWAVAHSLNQADRTAPPGTYFPPAAGAATQSYSHSQADEQSALAAARPAAADARLTDRFREIQDRLEALGATYMRLEADPNDRGRYRFYCQMALAEHYDAAAGGTIHPFEAVADDPVLAMERVLASVETWHAGRM